MAPLVKAVACSAALIAIPASAQEPRMSLDGPSGMCFAVVVIENRLGAYNRDETLQTEHGPVVLHYHTVRGHQPGDDDEITVVSLPDGVMADPMQMALPDGQTGRVCLMEWLGG